MQIIYVAETAFLKFTWSRLGTELGSYVISLIRPTDVVIWVLLQS